MNILHEPSKTEPFIVVCKERGIPSAPLKNSPDSAYTRIKKLFPECDYVKGKKEIEGGLLHRLDTDTEGLLLIASGQEFYDHLIKEQNDGKFIKTYRAVCQYGKDNKDNVEGFAPLPENMQKILNDFTSDRKKKCEITAASYFRPYSIGRKQVRPITEESGKYQVKKASGEMYTTNILLTREEDNVFNATCTLAKGYRHQVRCHLAWISYPIIGDKTYNPHYKGEDFCFFASGIKFNWENKLFTYSI